jgi:hypothetical protein
VGEDVLVMQLRGGEIWGKVPPCFGGPWDGPPPCYYYLSLLPRFKRWIMLCLDDRNPCVQQLVRAGVEWRRNGTTKERVALSVYARNYALSRSSWARVGLYLSPYPKKFFTFLGAELPTWERMDWAYRFYLEFGPHENCVPSEEYQRRVMDWWDPKPEIVRLVTDSNCTWQLADSPNWSWKCEDTAHKTEKYGGATWHSYCRP